MFKILAIQIPAHHFVNGQLNNQTSKLYIKSRHLSTKLYIIDKPTSLPLHSPFPLTESPTSELCPEHGGCCRLANTSGGKSLGRASLLLWLFGFVACNFSSFYGFIPSRMFILKYVYKILQFQLVSAMGIMGIPAWCWDLAHLV